MNPSSVLIAKIHTIIPYSLVLNSVLCQSSFRNSVVRIIKKLKSGVHLFYSFRPNFYLYG
jgi:hypothetical protein